MRPARGIDPQTSITVDAPIEPEAAIFRSLTRKPCWERALVLQACGIPHRVVREGPSHFLLVPTALAQRALKEVNDYGVENEDWPPAHMPPPFLEHGLRASWVYALGLGLFYPVVRFNLAHLDWWDRGKLVADEVLQGEWWRTTTALTLHGGAGHLMGNLAFGWGFALLAVHTMGTGITWMGILVAGTLGNLINAAIQDPSHTSIGASTAVFGCLGLMASYEWMRRERLRLGSMRRLAPLLAAATLLGYLGMGSNQPGAPPTDVMAHVTGMGVGMALGAIIALTRLPDRLGLKEQRVLTLLVPCWIILTWALALTSR